MFGLTAGLGVGSLLVDIGTGIANYKQQQDLLNWQKEQFGTVMAREDTAAQRRVADLKAAGLSPTLAAGSAAAASQPMSMKAPEFKPSAQEKVLGVIAAMRQKKEIDRTQADIDLAKQKISTEKSLELLNTMNANEKAYNLEFYKGMALPTNATGISKEAAQIANIIKDRLIEPSVSNGATAVDQIIAQTRADMLKNTKIGESPIDQVVEAKDNAESPPAWISIMTIRELDERINKVKEMLSKAQGENVYTDKLRKDLYWLERERSAR